MKPIGSRARSANSSTVRRASVRPCPPPRYVPDPPVIDGWWPEPPSLSRERACGLSPASPVVRLALLPAGALDEGADQFRDGGVEAGAAHGERGVVGHERGIGRPTCREERCQ